MKRIIALVAAVVVSGAVHASAAPLSAKATVDGLGAKDLQSELATADDLYNSRRWDEAIAAYRAIAAKAPALTVALLQIASAYRYKGDYDRAILAYTELLRINSENDDALIGLGFANLEKGDLPAAERALTKAAAGRRPTREVFYNLGELKLLRGQLVEAATWYEKAANLDPSWEKAIVKLAVVRNASVHNNSR